MVWGLLHLALPLCREKEEVTLGLHNSILGDLPFHCPWPFRSVLVWEVYISSSPIPSYELTSMEGGNWISLKTALRAQRVGWGLWETGWAWEGPASWKLSPHSILFAVWQKLFFSVAFLFHLYMLLWLEEVVFFKANREDSKIIKKAGFSRS